MKEVIKKFAAAVVFLIIIIGVTFLVLISFDKKKSNPDETVMSAETQAESATQTVQPAQTESLQENTAELQTEVYTENLVTTEPPDEKENSSSKTVITSRVRKDYDDNAVYIDMENILQNPELPTGCEITSLTILLKYWGFDAEKTDMAKNYLPTSWGNAQYKDGELYKDSFFDYFIGDPFSTGYGCFSNPIEKAAEDYIADNGGGYTVINLSGSSPDVLYDYLAEGIPVLCWATDGMIEPEYYESWYDNATGEKLDWYLNEHCFVLAGFDMKNNLVTLNDPMKGIIDYNIDKFETRYAQMYSQAIVILKDDESSQNSE